MDAREMKRRTYLKTAGTAGLGLTGGCLASAAAGSSFLVGAYPGYPATSETMDPFERWLGRNHAVFTVYANGSSGQGVVDGLFANLREVWNAGHVPMVTWEPFLGTPEETPADIERRIAAGAYDEYVDRWIRAIHEWVNAGTGRRLYFRPLPEMNGEWVPWSAGSHGSTPGDFVEAWRYLYRRFNRAGLTGDQVQWVWNPNAGDSGVGRAERYYPGGGYVDWIGIDGYNFGDTRTWSEWQSPREVFQPMVERMRVLADKPLCIPEFGTTSSHRGAYRPRRKGRWISDAFDYVQEEGIKMACWFNIDKETDWAVFGSDHGNGVATLGPEKYLVYPQYRAACHRKGAIGGGTAEKGVITRDQFTGSF